MKLPATRWVLRLAITLMLPMLQGCQSVIVGSGPEEPPSLLPVEEGAPLVQANQRLTVTGGGRKNRQLVAVLDIEKSKLSIRGFDTLGIPVFKAIFNGETVSSWTPNDFEEPVPARWLLSEIQLAYWPKDLLFRSYDGGWSFSATKRKRVLWFRGRRIVTVICQRPKEQQKECFSPGSDVMIEHDIMDFDIRVETITVNRKGKGRDRL